MRICPVHELKEGDVLERTVFLPNNRLLIGAGHRITRAIKQKLIEQGYSNVYIQEGGTEGVIPEDVISELKWDDAQIALEGNVSRIKRAAQFQEETIDRAIESLKIGNLKHVDVTAEVKRTIFELVKDIIASNFRYISIIYPKSSDGAFYEHAVNTAVLSMIIGKRYRFPNNELFLLGLGAFLHDIGKVVINRLMERYEGKYEADYYREHPTFGYLLLRDDRLLSPLVLQVINQHHEQQDGKGFPLGLTGNNSPPVKDGSSQKGGIFRFAEICAVANSYDRLLLSRMDGDGDKYTPPDVIKEMTAGAGTVYSKPIIEKLCDIMPIYPVGSYVRINDIADSTLIGCYGVVARIKEENLKKPTLIVTTNKYQKKIKPILIDTSKLSRIELKMIL